MKKEKQTWRISVKNFFSNRWKTIKHIICGVLGILLAFIIAISAFNWTTTDEIVACKEELSSYLASPSRYAINTDIYTLTISKDGTTLSLRNSLAYCKAVVDANTNNYNYTVSRNILLTILGWFGFTYIFGTVFFFILEGLFAIVSDLYKHYKKFHHEHKLKKAQSELNVSRTDVEDFESSIQSQKEYERAYNKGHKEGYTDGRKKGFERGQQDSYLEGYEKGYADAMDSISTEVIDYMDSDE